LKAVRYSTRRAFLAIDQGGHASRALVFDPTGRPVSRGLREVGEHRIRPGWVEQDPEELVTSIREAVDEAMSGLDDHGPELTAGMATQRSSIVCWDRETGEALSPVLSWQDRRAHAFLDEIAGHSETIHRKTGLRLTAHYGASKLRWCLHNLAPVREARTSGRLACGPLASFLASRLLEERPAKIDPANAARTLLLNLHDLAWDDDLLELFDVPREVLPECVPTRHDFGRLDAGGSNVPLCIVNGDQSAALFAHGMPEEGTAYVNLGTGAFIQRVANRDPGSAPGLLTGVVLQDGAEITWVLEGTVNGAGSALARVGRELGVEDVDENLADWLEETVDPPLFLNGISGLGSPWWIPDFESRFVGEGEPRQKMAAVAESIVFLLCVNLECLQRVGSRFERVRATGGLAWNDPLCQRFADLTGLAVERPAEHEATARGTAFLVAGRPESWPDRVEGRRFEPREAPGLTSRFDRWKEALTSAVDDQGKRGGVGNRGAGGEDGA
jgi:glycerol kinase